MSANSFHAIGHLGGDVELRYLEDGTPLANFSVAVNEKRREEEIVLWVRCSLFGERAEKLAPYLVTGKHVYVRGPIREREWDDDQGVHHVRWGIVVDDVQLLGGGDQADGEARPQQQRSNQPQSQNRGQQQNRGNYQPRRQGNNRGGGGRRY